MIELSRPPAYDIFVARTLQPLLKTPHRFAPTPLLFLVLFFLLFVVMFFVSVARRGSPFKRFILHFLCPLDCAFTLLSARMPPIEDWELKQAGWAV
jgi:hypothetical protein